MAYRSILICLEHAAHVKPLVKLAEMVSADKNSLITAIHVKSPTQLHQSVAPYFTNELLIKLKSELEKEIKSLGDNFTAATAEADLNARWFVPDGHRAGDLQPYIDQSLVSDLTIAEQPYPGNNTMDLQKALLLKAGIPIILVPRGITEFHPDRHLSIAWNGTQESAKAVRDALPLLVNAEKVSVVCIGSSNEADPVHFIGGEEVKVWLRLHGIEAHIQQLEENRHDTGKKLVDYARASNTDLLIMGGFGHSRLYDVIVGAATGDVIRSAELPIFLSH